MKLNEHEKIQSWTIVVKTIDGCKAHGEGRELSFEDLGLEIYYTISKQIDETLEAMYPCEWVTECEDCKKLGETTCGNDISMSCFESKQ